MRKSIQWITSGLTACFIAANGVAGSMGTGTRPFTVLAGGEYGATELSYSASQLISFSAIARNPSLYTDLLEQSSQQISRGFGLHLGVESPVWSIFSLGGELGYKDFGKSENKADFALKPITRILSDTAYDALFVGRFTWQSGVNVFAKAGVAYTNTHLDQGFLLDPRNPAVENINGYHRRFSNFVPELVVGVGWNIYDRFNVYLNYAYLDGYSNVESGEFYTGEGNLLLDAPTKVANLNLFSVGAEILL